MGLIDADKFRSFLDRQYHNCHGYSGYKKELYREALRAVKSYVHSEGQIDAVPVVRCKDCAVPHNKYTGCPMLNGLVTPPDFYCPFGERKDGDD